MSDIHHLTTNILLVEFCETSSGSLCGEMAEDATFFCFAGHFTLRSRVPSGSMEKCFAAGAIVTERDGDLSGAKESASTQHRHFPEGRGTHPARSAGHYGQPGQQTAVHPPEHLDRLVRKTKDNPQTADQDLTIVAELVIGIGTAELIDSRTENSGSREKSLPRDPSFVRRRGQECQHEKLEHGPLLRLALLFFKLMTLAVIGARVRLRCISWIL